MFKKTLSLTVIVCFFLTTLGPYPQAYADTVLGLPAPGTMVNLSPAYEPVMIKGLTVHKDNPFLFDFIVDTGYSGLAGDALKKEDDRLVKYFFACLTIPEKDLWVNLSPYEKDKMVPQALGQTALGRDLLAQDYILKQLTASLIYPEKDLGKSFWDRVYAKARQMYGTTQIPVNTFNKVWIVADKASVYEHGQTAFVVSGHMKVMLEEDYLALQKHNPSVIPAQAGIHSVGSQIVRAIVLPEIEKEVNTGKNFATLRQIFNSLILASWYKKDLKEALLTQVYANKSTVKGVSLSDLSVKQQIYQQYLKAYKKGVFNYIKEEAQPDGQTIPRKYFSGGFDSALVVTKDQNPAHVSGPTGNLSDVTVGLDVKGTNPVASPMITPDAAMTGEVQGGDLSKELKGQPPHYIAVLRGHLPPEEFRRLFMPGGGLPWEDVIKFGKVTSAQLQGSQMVSAPVKARDGEIFIVSFERTERGIRATVRGLNVDYERAQYRPFDREKWKPITSRLLGKAWSSKRDDFLFDPDVRMIVKRMALLFERGVGPETVVETGINMMELLVEKNQKGQKNQKHVTFRLGDYFSERAVTPEEVVTQLNKLDGMSLDGAPGKIKLNASVGGTTDAPMLNIKIGDEVNPRQMEFFNLNTIQTAIIDAIFYTAFPASDAAMAANKRKKGFLSNIPELKQATKHTSRNRDYRIRSLSRGRGDVVRYPDGWATPIWERQSKGPGGIDLNTSNGMQWKVSKDGRGVEMNIDPAMIERIRREGIDSLSPVILKMTPVSSIWSLVVK